MQEDKEGNGSTRVTAIIVVLCVFFQAEDGIRDVAVTGVQTCALPICDPSLRTIGVTQSRGDAPRRQETRALPFEDRYGDEPAGDCNRRRGVLCAAIGEMQALAAYRRFFALCFVGNLHGYRRWPADTRTGRAFLRGPGAAARSGDRSGHGAPSEQRGDRDAAGDLGRHGAARRDSLWLPSGLPSG